MKTTVTLFLSIFLCTTVIAQNEIEMKENSRIYLIGGFHGERSVLDQYAMKSLEELIDFSKFPSDSIIFLMEGNNMGVFKANEIEAEILLPKAIPSEASVVFADPRRHEISFKEDFREFFRKHVKMKINKKDSNKVDMEIKKRRKLNMDELTAKSKKFTTDNDRMEKSMIRTATRLEESGFYVFVITGSLHTWRMANMTSWKTNTLVFYENQEEFNHLMTTVAEFGLLYSLSRKKQVDKNYMNFTMELSDIPEHYEIAIKSLILRGNEELIVSNYRNLFPSKITVLIIESSVIKYDKTPTNGQTIEITLKDGAVILGQYLSDEAQVNKNLFDSEIELNGVPYYNVSYKITSIVVKENTPQFAIEDIESMTIEE